MVSTSLRYLPSSYFHLCSTISTFSRKADALTESAARSVKNRKKRARLIVAAPGAMCSICFVLQQTHESLMRMRFGTRVEAMEEKAKTLHELLPRWTAQFDTAELDNSMAVSLTPHATTALATKSAVLIFERQIGHVFVGRFCDCRVFDEKKTGTTHRRSSFAVILSFLQPSKWVFCNRSLMSLRFIRRPSKKLCCGPLKILCRQYSTCSTRKNPNLRNFNFK